MIRIVAVVLFCGLIAACGPRQLEPDAAFDCERCADWNEPIEPFRIHGNTWYVGTNGLSSILVDTGYGLVLIDAALPQSAEQIEANVRALGFDPLDIRYILLSHAHFDHAGGINALQRYTRAKVVVSEDSATVLQTGRLQEDDPQFANGPENTTFPAAKVDSVLPDGETLTVGEVAFTAVYTPGHTAGGTTWTWESCALGECQDVVYAASLTAVSAPGYSFAASGAAAQLTESAGRIAGLDCDVLLSPHPFFFGMHDKLERRDDGNPFVNSLACTFYAEQALGWLEQRLEAER
ncbi:MAG: subclass B3 metallo-beta-lactamase [Woeseiaceae bacterium]|nr:subclass B3 metallo-beta-lactamase [Woeseiaceae bacterium]